MNRTRTLPVRRLAAAAAALALLGVVSSCAGGADDSASSSGGDTGSMSEPAGAVQVESAPEAPAPADLADAPAAATYGQAFDSAGSSTLTSTSAARQSGGGTQASPDRGPELAPEPGEPRSLIRTGNVALRSDSVKDTLFDIRKILQQTRGEVSDESTTADDQGETETALMTLRVPVEQFDTALEALKDLGGTGDGVELIDASATTEDVSTQVIDTDVRVELQKRSIERISILLDRARSIRDIVNIERELARREADLGSLQKRQAFLSDQTSMSTISVSVEKPREVEEEVVEEEKDEPNAFVGGLGDGWDAFGDATSGLLTAVGALLPFAILGLVVGVPLRVWLRRRRTTPVTASA